MKTISTKITELPKSHKTTNPNQTTMTTMNTAANTVESIFNDTKKKRTYNAMINQDPFAEVRMSRIYHNGDATDKFLIEQMDEENNWRPIPGVTTTHSADYILVSNQKVHDLMNSVINKIKDSADNKITFEPLGHNPLIWSGKAYSERWYTKDISISPKIGGKIMLGIEARNSYDNSSKVAISFYGMSVTCANQFCSSNLFGTPFVISHFAKDGSLDESFDDVYNKIEWSASNFINISPKIDRLCDCRLNTIEKYYDFMNRCEEVTGLSLNDKKIRMEVLGKGATSKVKDLINPTAFYGAKDSLWSILNAYTAIETHENPGLSAMSKIERFMDFCIRESEKNEFSVYTEDAEVVPMNPMMIA